MRVLQKIFADENRRLAALKVSVIAFVAVFFGSLALGRAEIGFGLLSLAVLFWVYRKYKKHSAATKGAA